ncbi:hypothetical protein DERF_006642, partial [Dermatophagoides farinae]
MIIIKKNYDDHDEQHSPYWFMKHITIVFIIILIVIIKKTTNTTITEQRRNLNLTIESFNIWHGKNSRTIRDSLSSRGLNSYQLKQGKWEFYKIGISLFRPQISKLIFYFLDSLASILIHHHDF